MTEPLSASQIKKLGDRLRRAASPTPEDRLLLQQVLLSHEAAMTEVARILADELGLANTSRIKTEGTLLDKLRREKSNLARVDDIAGIRIQAVADRFEQDKVVAQVVARFPESEVKDRRENPSHGYRAVHVIVRHEGRRVEVQVRTVLQDAWAQIVERFADSVGRGLRYGETIANADIRKAFGLLQQLSLTIAGLEASVAATHDLAEVWSDLEEVPDDAVEHFATTPPVAALRERGGPITGEEFIAALRASDEADVAELASILPQIEAACDQVAARVLHSDS